ncbi:uncharacterized protein LOC128205581 isoform X2 [Mya arenaria]|uniref:uncharacterized protein LOC128205581 isoform X2 n=1 Tax=Mya arenaria TaxID=6604 RepID=UPI0022E80A41|nr:uncharacterized protein LOC128205581 isoform X2 [Mya arenaria]
MDGQCTLGCETGYKLTTTGCIKDMVADNDGSNSVVTIGVLGGVIAILSVSLALSVGYNVFMKRRQNREFPNEKSVSDSKAEEETRTYEQLQERMKQPNYQNVKDTCTDNYAVLFADTNM